MFDLRLQRFITEYVRSDLLKSKLGNAGLNSIPGRVGKATLLAA